MTLIIREKGRQFQCFEMLITLVAFAKCDKTVSNTNNPDLSKLIQDIDMTNMIEDASGVIVDKIEIGKFKVIKATNNSIHVLTIRSYELDGVPGKEVVTVSQQVMGNRILSIYAFHQMENITEALRTVDSIDEALKVTEIIN